MITVSLPADTHLGLVGGIFEREFGFWHRVEDARYKLEDGRYLAEYTREEMALVVGAAEWVRRRANHVHSV